jgi:hypothetical protein
MNIQEYFNEFMQDIYARSGASEETDSIVFTERMCEFLVNEAIIDEYAVVGYKKDNLGIRVDAWQFNDDSEVLRLFISDFRSGSELQSLNQTDALNNFKKLERFFSRSIKSNYSQLMEESDPAFGLAHTIYEKADNISKVQFIILSNAELSIRVQNLDEKEVQGFKCSYDIWDLSRLFRIEASGKGKEDMIVDFHDYYPDGIPCLTAFTGTRDYESYLLVMSGDMIADLYDRYGERLLEQNVRTFLQFRGNVNKGLRNTILNEPHMFFAYNNGLAATAESVEFQDGKTHISSVTNLQIVNGGQTMASIFTAKKKSKADLSNVYVQMKLSIIPVDYVESVVPKISEYANTQNKVNAADFFSNHPFHLRIEDFSRRLWAPSSEGGIRESHWFYERARGQYANAQANLTGAQQKQFLAKYPRYQMFTKTDLAKYEFSYNMLPHIVSLGAQKSFARFASEISKEWERREEQFNQLYFKRLIAKAILFKFLDKSVLKQPWYGGGFKANIVTYSLAKLMLMISETGKYLDLLRIWNQQRPSKALEEQLLIIAEVVNNQIQKTPPEITNVTEWCKRETCWYQVRQMRLSLSQEFIDELIDKEENTYVEKDAEKSQRIDNGISVQSYVVEKGADYWKAIREWNNAKQILSPMELSILDVSCSIPSKIPSEKQADILVNLEERVIKEGFPAS